jgi:hypothetical protein
MDIAFYHSQKAFYFYIEFVEQINHDQNAYLKLNSKDAIFFVYKKTIFDIPYDLRKKIHNQNHEEANHEPLDVIHLFKNMYQNMLYYFVQNMKPSNPSNLSSSQSMSSTSSSQSPPFSLEWNKEDFQKMKNHMERKMEKIIFLSFKQNVSYFELLDLFIERFDKPMHYEIYLQCIDHFLKKTIKMKYNSQIMKKNMERAFLEPFFLHCEDDPALCIQILLQTLGEQN